MDDIRLSHLLKNKGKDVPVYVSDASIGGHEFVEWMLEYEKFDNARVSGHLSSLSESEYKDCIQDSSLYTGYVLGITDTIRYLGFCTLPDETTREQIYEIVLKYLKAHPKQWHRPAATLVVLALQEAFHSPTDT